MTRGTSDDNEVGGPRERAIGERLRRVRIQQDRSLQDVEAESGGRLKASVVGAYERGERAVSIVRLRALADFYGVPIGELLPPPVDVVERAEARGGLVLDLVALAERADQYPELVRYVRTIEARRGDYNGQVLTIRSADLDALAAVLGRPAEELRGHLSGQGLLR